jgi:hypothetical protein
VNVLAFIGLAVIVYKVMPQHIDDWVLIGALLVFWIAGFHAALKNDCRDK